MIAAGSTEITSVTAAWASRIAPIRCDCCGPRPRLPGDGAPAPW